MAVKEKKDEKDEKDEAETKDQAKSQDDAEKRDESKGKDKDESKAKDQDKDESGDQSDSKAKSSGPSLGAKIFRAALFTFAATFLTAFLFADPIPNGLRVEFDLLASVKLALIAAVIAAVLRTAVGMLPVFADD